MNMHKDHSSTKTLDLMVVHYNLSPYLYINNYETCPFRVCKHQKVKIKPGDIEEGYAFAQSCFISAINIFEIVHSIDIVTRHTT